MLFFILIQLNQIINFFLMVKYFIYNLHSFFKGIFIFSSNNKWKFAYATL